MSVGLALAVAPIAARPAAAQQFHYKGRDMTYPNAIGMDLYLTALGGGLFDVTGSITAQPNVVGTNALPVKGIYGGGAMMATVAFPLAYSGTAQVGLVAGALAPGGVLGTSPITVATGPVWLYGGYLPLAFTLMPVGPPPPPPPAPVDFSGSYTFRDSLDQAHLGSTTVDLTMHFQPSGGLFSVTGRVQVTVHTGVAPEPTWVFPVSGAYDPSSVPAGGVLFAVGNAPPGSNAVLAVSRTGPKTLETLLTGNPFQFFGIYSLGIHCTAP